MLIPRVKAKEFIKYGFKKCKGVPSDVDCYFTRNCKTLW